MCRIAYSMAVRVCRASIDNMSLYRDTEHLSNSCSGWLAGNAIFTATLAQALGTH
jgi:hypothetical protein